MDAKSVLNEFGRNISNFLDLESNKKIAKTGKRFKNTEIAEVFYNDDQTTAIIQEKDISTFLNWFESEKKHRINNIYLTTNGFNSDIVALTNEHAGIFTTKYFLQIVCFSKSQYREYFLSEDGVLNILEYDSDRKHRSCINAMILAPKIEDDLSDFKNEFEYGKHIKKRFYKEQHNNKINVCRLYEYFDEDEDLE